MCVETCVSRAERQFMGDARQHAFVVILELSCSGNSIIINRSHCCDSTRLNVGDKSE